MIKSIINKMGYDLVPRKQLNRIDGLKFEMEYKGHKIYSFQDLDHTPKVREMMMRITFHKMELGIKDSDFEVWMKLLKERFNEGDHVEVGALIANMTSYRNSFNKDRLVLGLGGYSLVIDDEPLIPNQKYNAIKKEMVKDIKMSAFFLTMGLNQLEALGMKLSSSLKEEYLIQTKDRLNRETLFLKALKLKETDNLWDLQLLMSDLVSKELVKS